MQRAEQFQSGSLLVLELSKFHSTVVYKDQLPEGMGAIMKLVTPRGRRVAQDGRWQYKFRFDGRAETVWAYYSILPICLQYDVSAIWLNAYEADLVAEEKNDYEDFDNLHAAPDMTTVVSDNYVHLHEPSLTETTETPVTLSMLVVEPSGFCYMTDRIVHRSASAPFSDETLSVDNLMDDPLYCSETLPSFAAQPASLENAAPQNDLDLETACCNLANLLYLKSELDGFLQS